MFLQEKERTGSLPCLHPWPSPSSLPGLPECLTYKQGPSRCAGQRCERFGAGAEGRYVGAVRCRPSRSCSSQAWAARGAGPPLLGAGLARTLGTLPSLAPTGASEGQAEAGGWSPGNLNKEEGIGLDP